MKVKKSFTFMLLALMAGGAMGQSRIWQMPNIPTDTAIVREWHDGQYIVYTRRLTNPGVFSYHDNASSMVKTVQVPAGVVINDFRIAKDTVYMGGSYGTGANQRGYLACFTIQDLLNGSVTFNATTFPIVPMWNGSTPCIDLHDNYIVKGITRLSLFDSSQKTWVAYISENVITDGVDPSIIFYHRIGHGAAAYSLNGWINMPYHYNKDGNEKYTDVALTNNYIVMAAWSDTTLLVPPSAHVQTLQIFSKIPGYVGTSVPITDRYYSTDHDVQGKVMITALRGDQVAVAYHYKNLATGAIGLAVKLYDVTSGSPQLLHSLEFQQHTVFQRIG